MIVTVTLDLTVKPGTLKTAKEIKADAETELSGVAQELGMAYGALAYQVTNVEVK